MLGGPTRAETGSRDTLLLVTGFGTSETNGSKVVSSGLVSGADEPRFF